MARGEAGALDVPRHFEAIARVSMLTAWTPVASPPFTGSFAWFWRCALPRFTRPSIAPFRFGTTRTIARRTIAPLRSSAAWAAALRSIAPLGSGRASTIVLRSIAPGGAPIASQRRPRGIRRWPESPARKPHHHRVRMLRLELTQRRQQLVCGR
jgi:hypothetical protein